MPPTQDLVTIGGTPGSPDGAIAPTPGQAVTIRANPLTEYVAGGVGGSGNWFINYSRSLPWAIDDVTQDFGDDLYTRMMMDAQVASAVNVLKASILEDGLHVEPAVDDGDADGYELSAEIADVAQRMLADLEPDTDTVLWNMLDAVALGNRVAEQVYRLDRTYTGRQQLVLESLRVKPRHATAFVVDAYMRMIGLFAAIPGVSWVMQQQMLIDTVNAVNLLPRDKFLIYSFRPINEDPRGTSLLRPAYTPWHLKQQILREHVKYLTQFASPSLIGYTSQDAHTRQATDAYGNLLLDGSGNPLPALSPEQSLTASLTDFKNGVALGLPFGSKVDIIMSQGDGAAFRAAIDGYNRDITHAVLSQTLATNEGEHQARAAAETHKDVQDTIVRQAKRSLEHAVRRDVLRPWVRYNYGDRSIALTPRCTLGRVEQPDIAALMTAIAELQKSGYIQPSQYAAIDTMINLPVRTADELPPTEKEKQQMAADIASQQQPAPDAPPQEQPQP